ncbi:hypothetical protein [Gordonia aquimaris]|uniref:Uncharacterized protein n=1 Tax=Gordonia aquimaris TaxID=2984863 RepID=A0A9X3D6Y1_9ACTN|nr:hypothetical protein [Gordonia aquimaris]MCX2966198.1 hypothetical protein [Gordonia aquimaris]
MTDDNDLRTESASAEGVTGEHTVDQSLVDGPAVVVIVVALGGLLTGWFGALTLCGSGAVAAVMLAVVVAAVAALFWAFDKAPGALTVFVVAVAVGFVMCLMYLVFSV